MWGQIVSWVVLAFIVLLIVGAATGEHLQQERRHRHRNDAHCCANDYESADYDSGDDGSPDDDVAADDVAAADVATDHVATDHDFAEGCSWVAVIDYSAFGIGHLASQGTSAHDRL